MAYADAHALQHGLFAHSADDHLLLLEHPHVFTLGPRRVPRPPPGRPAEVGAELVHTDRGGDITYHGPGQLVGYPILTVPGKRGGGMADTVAYVRSVEQLLIDVLADLGLADVGRVDGLAGVWVAPDSPRPRKVAAIGVKLSRGRSMHGFALNVDPDLAWFDRIVPCGIADKGVTSLRAEGLDVDDGRGRRRRGRPRRRALGLGRLGAGRREGPALRRAGEGRRPRHRRAQAGVAPGPGAAGRGLPGPAQAHAPPRPGHRVRGGGLSQHLRVLGRRHGHLHAQRRALHPGLRLLPGRHPQARRPAGGRRARAGGRGGGRDGPALRRAHRRGPRRPARRWRRPVRGDHRGHPATQPGHRGRGADPGLQGRPRRRST